MTHNLPAQLSSFVGRKQNLLRARRLIQANRLLTLTGSGGIGKTRLAIEAARGLGDRFSDGVCCVDLAPVTDDTLVPQTVADALGIHEHPGRPVTLRLCSFLEARRLLLLDNCEHLLGGCSDLCDALLRGCPALTIVATSRLGLGIPGEVVWQVPALTLSQPNGAGPWGADGRKSATASPPKPFLPSEAAQLFVERAQSVDSAFSLTPEDAAAVEDICLRLDGIPLAIELAAASVTTLTPPQIAEHLASRFLFISSHRAVPARQRTLGASLDWSYELLTEPERLLLARLSVFTGGWTLAAAEDICLGDGISREDVLRHLSQLIRKSLVIAEPRDREMRYHLLETVRQYSATRLPRFTTGALKNRHLAWCLNLVRTGAPNGKQPLQPTWFSRVDAEGDNLRAALEWAMASEQPMSAMKIAGKCWWFWWARGRLAEGRKWFAEVLSHPQTQQPTVWRAEALTGAAMLARESGDYRAAAQFATESLAIEQGLGDTGAMIFSLSSLSWIHAAQGEFLKAEQFAEQRLAYAASMDDREMGHSLADLAWMDMSLGNLDAAQTKLNEALAIFRRINEPFFLAYTLFFQAVLAGRRESFEKAHELAAESLRIFRQLGDHRFSIEVMETLARLAARQGQPERALRLVTACSAHRDAAGLLRFPVDQDDLDACLKPIKERWPAFGERLQADAASMTFEETVEYALGSDSGRQPRAPTPASGSSVLLTRRERDVVSLLASGLTNRQIAVNLNIAEGTAGLHVRHILHKLGFRSRAQVTAWAIQQGIELPAG